MDYLCNKIIKCMSKKSRDVIFSEKKSPCGNANTSHRGWGGIYIYIYIYIYCIYSQMYLSRYLSSEPFNASVRPCVRRCLRPISQTLPVIADTPWYLQKHLVKLLYFNILCNSIADERYPPSKT